MTAVSAGLVKELRDLTGAGMMDCKRALVETNGDLEEARRLLREKGLADAGKRAGRETTEGKVLVRVEDGRGAIVAVGSETEPVSKNDEFLDFGERLLDLVFAEGPESVSDLEDERVEAVAKLGENVVVVGAERYEGGEGEVVASYVHPPAAKIGVLVLARSSPELARMVAMHVAAARPAYVSREEIPESEVAKEREIYEKLPEVASKPEHVRPKIVQGMIEKRLFAQSVLLEQDWIHDPSVKVGQALAEHGSEVRAFALFNVGQ